jgi:hypothetical protein
VPPAYKCADARPQLLHRDRDRGELDTERWVDGLAEIDEHVAPLVRELDHQVLNEIDGLGNPTSEMAGAVVSGSGSHRACRGCARW